MNKFTFLFLISFGSIANAQQYCRTQPLGTLLDSVALNAAAASRTFTVGPTIGNDSLLQYKMIVLEVEYTHANNGALTILCKQGQTVATADKYMTICSVTSGTCTLYTAGSVATQTLTGSLKYSFPLGISGAKAISCTITHGGAPNASDIVSIVGHLVGSGC